MAQVLAGEFAVLNHTVEILTDTPCSDNSFAFSYPVTRTTKVRDRVASFRRADVALFMNVSLRGLPAAKIATVPVVVSHQGIYEGSIAEAIKCQVSRRVPGIAASAFIKAHVPGCVRIIPNAYDPKIFIDRVVQKRTKDFVFCGRLVSDKGAAICIRAFQRVSQEFPEATLTIIGDGPERNVLRNLASRLSLSKAVTFEGALSGDRVAAAMRQHSCLVVPSVWEEPFGIVALEGIASCDTVIASARGGLPEAIGCCGVTVRPTVEEFALAMLGVMRARHIGIPLPGMPSNMQRTSHLERHSPRVIATSYLEVLAAAAN